jgi:type IV pilus assembly protein PilW
VEILVALAIMGIVLEAVYGSLISTNRSYHTQESVVDTQQRARAGIDFIGRDVRMAGFDPLGTAGAGIEVATATKIRITSDRDMNGVVDDDDGISTRNEERVTYSFSGSTLFRQLYENTSHEQSQQPMIDDVSALTFSYLDADGSNIAVPVLTSNLETIRTVSISITCNGQDAQGNTFSRVLNTRVICRNINTS